MHEVRKFTTNPYLQPPTEATKQPRKQRESKGRRPKVIAVYAIVCKATKRAYVGQSIDVKNRINQHKWSLKKGKHDNYFIQQDYDKYPNAFTFTILEEVQDVAQSLIRETEHIEALSKSYRMYNRLHNTDATIIPIAIKFAPIMNRVKEYLDKGRLTVEDLERALDNL